MFANVKARRHRRAVLISTLTAGLIAGTGAASLAAAGGAVTRSAVTTSTAGLARSASAGPPVAGAVESGWTWLGAGGVFDGDA
jgi:hypothetical protein